MSEYTKGPIEILAGGQNICIKFPNGITIVVGDAIYNRERSLEIANMLAAAPDMYEALERVVKNYENSNDMCDAILGARLALSKAEGKD